MPIAVKFFFKLVLFCCYILLSHGHTNLNAGNLKLDLVQVLFRHGARTPVLSSFGSCKIANTSPYESYGFGELTNEGKEQEYKLGSLLRYRYNDYLGGIYKPEDVYAYASDMPRTKKSLELLLDGLYPPVGPGNWNTHLTPRIPYLFTPKNLDTFLGSYKNPKFLKPLLQKLKSHEIASKIASYSDFTNFVKQTGVVSNCSSPLLTIGLTHEVLVANEYMKLPLPDWYTPEIREKFKEIVELAWDTIVGVKESQKLGAGSLMKTLIGNLNLNGKNDNAKKIYLYAGHDVNICLFTRAHDIREFQIPPFGSALILEKFRDFKNQTYLRLLAWDGIDKLETLKLGKHAEFCPIEDYLKITESMLPSEEETNEMLDEIVDVTSSKKIQSLLFSIVNSL